MDTRTAPERLIELGATAEVRPLVAANAGTPSAYLEELSKDKSRRVRQAVAQNPNAPLDCLLNLSREFPAAFFANPLCPLLDLTQPGWYEQVEDLTWLFWLKSEKIPQHWLNQVEAEKRRRGAASHSIGGQAGDVWVAARLHIALPALHTGGEHITPEMARNIGFVARHERTPVPLLHELAAIVCQYDDVMEIGNAVCEQIRRDVAQNSAAPEQILRQLAQDKDPKVRYRIGRNPSTPADLLDLLTSDSSAYVRSGVAANPATPVALLERLAWDTNYEEKYARARHQIVPKARLNDVSRMQAQEALNNIKLVKGALAGNVSTPLPVLMHLASHPEHEVRARLAANPAVPAEVLLGLVTDVEPVLWTLVEKNVHVPAEALETLAAHENGRVRIGVASHPNTPLEALARLAGDSNVRVREAVAKNPRTPERTLASLLAYGETIDGTDTIVRVALAKNPAVPPELLARLASNQTRTITSALAKNPQLSPALIEQLIKDANEVVRQQIVNHPNLSRLDLENLAQDANVQVQRSAQERLNAWDAAGARGQQVYSYWGNLDDPEKPDFRASTPANIPFYEMQRRVQALRPAELRDFLAHFRLPADVRSELFALLLPSWLQNWQEHMRHMQLCLELLEAFDLPAAWQGAIANSPLWQERYALALKPGVETSVLARLADDGNRYVRAAARWYLQ